MISRRSLIRLLSTAPVAFVALGLRPRALSGKILSHPEPRAGITGDDVISAEQLRSEGFDDDVIALYDGIRAMPEIADGLACYCGCELMGNRSLLTCFHPTGMARGCQICQGEARMAIRRHAEGHSLERIRRAIDARYAGAASEDSSHHSLPGALDGHGGRGHHAHHGR